jgi:Flp pilus assembly protein TadB
MVTSALTIVAALLTGGCVALAWSHLARIGRTGGSSEALSVALKRVAKEERARELAKRAPSTSWEKQLADDVLAAQSDVDRLVAVNDAVAEAQRELDQSAGWPAAGVRISVLGGLLLAAAAYLATQEISPALRVAVVGAAGALGCYEAGRRAKDRSRKHRAAIDALVRVVAGHLDGVAIPTRRRPGFRGGERATS